MSQVKITAFFTGKRAPERTKEQLLEHLQEMIKQLDTSKCKRYEHDDLFITVYEDVFSQEFCDVLFQLMKHHGHYKRLHTNKDGQLSLKRNKCTYGSIDDYVIKVRDEEISNKVHPWEAMPILKEMSDMFVDLTKDEYNVCTVQYYNNGKVGIKPHRDKEMIHGTVITSLSLGCTRTMRFQRGDVTIDIPLAHGSLCCIYPPTNDKWTHSIPLDNTTKPRISLIFRRWENKHTSV